DSRGVRFSSTSAIGRHPTSASLTLRSNGPAKPPWCALPEVAGMGGNIPNVPERYDVAIIGAGTGGYSCALRSAELGLRVLLIERDERLGGTCLLRGCIPTKALLRSAEILDDINRAEEWGIKASGEPDWSGIEAFQQRTVDKLVNGVTGLIKMRGVEL